MKKLLSLLQCLDVLLLRPCSAFQEKFIPRLLAMRQLPEDMTAEKLHALLMDRTTSHLMEVMPSYPLPQLRPALLHSHSLAVHPIAIAFRELLMGP